MYSTLKVYGDRTVKHFASMTRGMIVPMLSVVRTFGATRGVD